MNLINNETSDKDKEFEYKKVASHSIKLDCISYTFNTNSAILFIGCQLGNIKVFGFYQRLRLIQSLKQHEQCVTCLVFQKKTNQLISGSGDKLIIIWNQGQYNQWRPHQILQGHIDWINCMIINENEDLLISGSEDKSIKFWRKENEGWNSLQTIQLPSKVVSMSLNFSERKLITFVPNKFFSAFRVWSYAIQVIECQPDQQWFITSTIKCSEKGLRLGFINDNSFVFQPQMKQYLEIYNFQEEKQQFVKSNQIQTQQGLGYDNYYYFPPQFIRQQNLFVIKHGQCINFFQVDLSGDLLLKQSIKFKDSYLFGRLTVDGKYLVTYDSASNQIQTRKQGSLSWFL